MPTIIQPAMGSRGSVVAHEAPPDHSTDKRDATINGAHGTVNGHRPTVNPTATLPGIDNGTREAISSVR